MSPFVGLAGMGGRTSTLFGRKASGAITVDTVDPFGDNSCIATWKLDTAVTDLTNNSVYTLSGSTGSGNFTTGNFGTAFNGTGSNSLYSGNANLNIAGNYSASFWYRSGTTNQDNKRLLTIRGTQITAGWNNWSGSLGFYYGLGSSTNSVDRVAQIPDSAVNNNAWHHLVFTITTGGGYVIYLDGSQYSNPVSGEGRSFNSGTYLSITNYDGGGTSYNTIGQVDQLRLFNRVLTADEVLALYNETE